MVREHTSDSMTGRTPAAVPGMTVRHFRGEEDYPLIAAIMRACSEADRLEQAVSAGSIGGTFEHLVNCDPARDAVFVEVNGEPVAYGRVFWYPPVTGEVVYVVRGCVLPEWRRKGIGTALLGWQEARLREIAATHLPGGAREFGAEAYEHQQDKRALLEHAGYQVVTMIAEMVRPDLENIPDAPLPAGFEVRPVRGADFRAIYDAEQEAFHGHFGWMDRTGSPDFDGWYVDHPDFDPSLWRVAWCGGEVAGMVRSFILTDENKTFNRKRGYAENISVRAPYRRRGLARALLVQSLHALRERGMQEAALSVHMENANHALDLYERTGFRVARRMLAYRKPLD